ncbi:hypothetical protein NKR23_g6666 [Pleurostoma richardsiae]|uniref:Uncharacterized protein n=1 Tax=Pleurostoma richardsiae TaxID=41990 RepID=A0AA38VE18_9PEZI|nr:hypothetical protein NKR23_g6666 [Pleurostoma richardsiae]
MDGTEPSAEQKARLHKVADLLLDIYKTLAEMRYIDPQGIRPGPHNITAIRPLYEKFGLDPAVVYLYSILPYIDTDVAGNSDFFHGGAFANFLDPEDVEQGRDPMYGSPEGDDYESEDGPYMRPWVTPLSMMGNHQSVIIYDARLHRIWIIDQESWDTTDPKAVKGLKASKTDKNRNSYVAIPNRPAEEVLGDINTWFRTLEELPGSNGEQSGGEWNSWDEVLDLRGLYRKNGWPDNFDGDAFQVDQARGYAASMAKDHSEQPVKEVRKFTSWAKFGDQDVHRARDALAKATTEDEEWSSRYTIWSTEQRIARNQEEIKKAEEEAERLCPGGVCQKREDLPLWEFEQLWHEYRWKKESVDNARNWAEGSKDEPEREREFLIEQRRNEKEALVYQKAYEASKADAERLCPGKTFESATGIKSLGRKDTLSSIQDQKDIIFRMERELEKTREWLAQVPQNAVKTRETVTNDIKGYEEGIDGARKSKERDEKWLAEHGNTD